LAKGTVQIVILSSSWRDCEYRHDSAYRAYLTLLFFAC